MPRERRAPPASGRTAAARSHTNGIVAAIGFAARPRKWSATAATRSRARRARGGVVLGEQAEQRAEHEARRRAPRTAARCSSPPRCFSGWSAKSAAAASAGHSGTGRRTGGRCAAAGPRLPFPLLRLAVACGGRRARRESPARARIRRANCQARRTTARWMRTFVTCQTRGRNPSIAWFAANGAAVSGRGICEPVAGVEEEGRARGPRWSSQSPDRRTGTPRRSRGGRRRTSRAAAPRPRAQSSFRFTGAHHMAIVPAPRDPPSCPRAPPRRRAPSCSCSGRSRFAAGAATPRPRARSGRVARRRPRLPACRRPSRSSPPPTGSRSACGRSPASSVPRCCCTSSSSRRASSTS